MDNRDEFLAMLSKAERGEIEAVVVVRLDRLARDLVDSTTTIKLLNTYGCTLLAGDDISNPNTPEGEFVRGISQRSGLRAGFLSALRQPLLCHDAAQPLIIPSATYLESVTRRTLHFSLRAESPIIAAVSSIRLLVVFFSPPESSFSCAPKRRTTPQPPGPGLPEQAPSVKISTYLSIILILSVAAYYLAEHHRVFGINGRKIGIFGHKYNLTVLN